MLQRLGLVMQLAATRCSRQPNPGESQNRNERVEYASAAPPSIVILPIYLTPESRQADEVAL